MRIQSTTIVAVKHRGHVAIAGDGQVTMENAIIKNSAVKVRRMHHDRIIAGFAGSAADALTLFERFEAKLEETRGNLRLAAVEFAKEWRTDRIMRRLEALLLVTDGEHLLMLSGSGEIIEPDGGVAAIGSGGGYAAAAARALARHSDLSAELIAQEALAIAAELCIYTNSHITVEVL